MLEVLTYLKTLIDFTKALDIADHTVLMPKLAELQIPGNIYNWIGSFLCARRQIYRFNGTFSMLKYSIWDLY